MCGFTGFLTPTSFNATASERWLCKMCDSIAHRGPDDFGYWMDADAGIALGHRRLSIIDLSAQGHQPMISMSGRFALVYNGEIYNFEQIRKTLDRSAHPPVWKGHSDTEVLLAAIEAWGVEPTLRKLYGMFSFALWDRSRRVLTLARDPVGEKPLYYGWVDNVFLFGSELKALRCYPGFVDVPIDRDALRQYIRYNCVPAPDTIYKNIKKLLPGTIATIRAGISNAHTAAYWSVADAVTNGMEKCFSGSEDDAVDELDALVRTVLSEQMVADVSVGAFLSGGIDSSTVVALMQTQATKRIQTFTIGFDDAGHNEARDAKAIAQHLGTQHTELYVSPSMALEVVPELPSIYDEPFADSSQIPTLLVSQLTRRTVTVSLSGDGGDEVFGGYNRHVLAQRFWNNLGYLPAPARRSAARLIKSVRGETLDRAIAPFIRFLPANRQYTNIGEKLHKLADVIGAVSFDAFYRRLTSTCDTAEDVVLQANVQSLALASRLKSPPGLSATEQMMYLDTVRYLPDDILTKVDRAAMSVSLETRIPFLDRRIVEFSWRLPLSMKVRDGEGKRILRKLLHRYVPLQLVNRPKHGFSVPIGNWLRGELRDWAADLLSPARIESQNLLNPRTVGIMWQQHLAGTHNWQHQLWTVLMFQAWLDTVRNSESDRAGVGSSPQFEYLYKADLMNRMESD
ncbi:asparagine synthase (glutamine-hydrolyzing) [Paraburkholderia sp. CNPSo 3157]|uniref:asparagine synthase (glutamine-hydrolyzing) n=1 Tax=Paraburkholderia franconis TaxID=2654983 RepID=A0A7X1TFN3_9BURK|nr:asparagine synthase (glutamine-hydrolyzing) [Paraburkholderia franconis]MPW17411.1 asparagine synthase (glutamine-hydrolyzing) [Paraburkholderia franconis]